MNEWLHGLGERRKYRLVAVPLVLVPLFVVFALASVGLAWLGFLIGIGPYVLLVIATYLRLKRAGLSGGWLAPMILTINFGPRWELGNHVSFHPMALLWLLPVLLAWFAAERADDANTKDAIS